MAFLSFGWPLFALPLVVKMIAPLLTKARVLLPWVKPAAQSVLADQAPALLLWMRRKLRKAQGPRPPEDNPPST